MGQRDADGGHFSKLKDKYMGIFVPVSISRQYLSLLVSLNISTVIDDDK